MRKVKIADRLVGKGEPSFIIAEIGVNHNGQVNVAKRLIDAAKNSGADAVKFQVFKTGRIVTRYAAKPRYQKETTDPTKSQYQMLEKLELKDREIKGLFNYAQKKRILFLSSAFDEESVDFLDRLGVPAFKIASGETTNLPLLRHIAEKKKPIILSTGLSTLGEVEEALEVITEEGVEDIVLLHCVTSYPARTEDINLRVIKTLEHSFGFPVGFSDHTLGITAPIAAVALGAVLIEKHFTLDKNLQGPDHRASLEPHEFKGMVNAIRDVEKALGDGVKRLTSEEKEIKKAARRSIVARVRIKKGTTIKKDLLDFKRPGVGLEPKYMSLVIGMKAKKNIDADELITFDKLSW